jgi:uncharacterized membrane protein
VGLGKFLMTRREMFCRRCNFIYLFIIKMTSKNNWIIYFEKVNMSACQILDMFPAPNR